MAARDGRLYNRGRPPGSGKKQKRKLAEQRRRDRAKADRKKSEKMPVDDVPTVDLTINTDEYTDDENEESEFEKFDEICDTESTGENDAENTDTDATKEVND